MKIVLDVYTALPYGLIKMKEKENQKNLTKKCTVVGLKLDGQTWREVGFGSVITMGTTIEAVQQAAIAKIQALTEIAGCSHRVTNLQVTNVRNVR